MIVATPSTTAKSASVSWSSLSSKKYALNSSVNASRADVLMNLAWQSLD